MSLTTPILNSIIPFDAKRFFKLYFFTSGGNQVSKNNLKIERISDSVIVYDKIEETFSFSHNIDSNSLLNGTTYRFMIRTGDINGNWSQFSNAVVITPISTPEISIINITDGIVNNQSYSFQGKYEQKENEPLDSYNFNLYDENGILLLIGEIKYDNFLKYQFDKFENDSIYQIEFRIKTLNGLEMSTEKYKFTVQYSQPKIENVIHLENVCDTASVKIATQIIRLVWEIQEGEPFFEYNEWVNLKNSKIFIQKGFSFNGDFTLRIWLRYIERNVSFLKLYTMDGTLDFKIHHRYGIDKIYVYKKLYNDSNVVDLIYSEEIENYNENMQIYIYFQQKSNRLYIYKKEMN